MTLPMDDLKQPEALRLADALDAGGNFYAESSMWFDTKLADAAGEAAAELRRLSVSEREGWRYADELEQERKRLETTKAELLEALAAFIPVLEFKSTTEEGYLSATARFEDLWDEADTKARAAIAKHGGEA